MKRRGIHPVVFTLALVLLCSGASYAIFPGQTYGLSASVGDGALQVQLQHGWWQGADTWYSCFATNNIRAAQTLGLTLSPKLIGANYAPLLGSTLISARSSMWVIDWRQTLPGGALLKVLANQYPVLSDCPTDCSWRNTNFGYSPVEDMFILQRNLALISPEVLFNNVPFIQQQMTRGALLSAPGIPVNAPVICAR